MFRSLLQWEISRRVDDGVSLGPWLTWIVEHDPKSLEFYQELLALENRLHVDAVRILDRRSKERKQTPLRIAPRKTDLSATRRAANGKTAATVAILFVALTGLGSLFLGTWLDNACNTVYAGPTGRSVLPPTAVVQSDPAIFNELVQLCKTTPNEVGPFFNSPNY